MRSTQQAAPPAALLLDQWRALLQRNGCFQVLGKLQRALGDGVIGHRDQQLLVRGLARLEQVEEVVVAIKGANAEHPFVAQRKL